MIYCFDIDGTICSSVLQGKYNEACPYRKRIEYVNKLFNEGHKIIYYTARCSSKSWFYRYIINYFKTWRQLKSWGCLFDKLKVGKLSYDLWIDDKAREADEYFWDIK